MTAPLGVEVICSGAERETLRVADAGRKCHAHLLGQLGVRGDAHLPSLPTMWSTIPIVASRWSRSSYAQRLAQRHLL